MLIKVLQNNCKSEYEILNNLNVNIEICIVEWIFSLFSSIIPIDIQIDFYSGFYSEGWTFFYKMCISVLESIELKNENFKDPEDVYIALKKGKDYDSNKKQFTKKWAGIIRRANQININI
jgi:hypothetical protein